MTFFAKFIYVAAFICVLPIYPACSHDSFYIDFSRQGPTFDFGYDFWDFGTILETNGAVFHTFQFINNGDSPAIIERVNTDCGCTVPKYVRVPIKPGESSEITITFDPRGYVGRITRSVTIITDNGRTRISLKVSADVQPRERTADETFPYLLAEGIRADALHHAFGYVENGSSQSAVIRLVNTSNQPARLSVGTSSQLQNLEVSLPEQLNPGEVAIVILTYDLTAGADIYGMLADRLYIAVNGNEASLAVNANAVAVDNFSKMSKSKQPVCEISPSLVSMDTISPGGSASRGVKITNTGKAPLIIRYVESRKNTEIALRAGTTIYPGKSITVTVTLSAGNTTGTVSGSATILTNDPSNPMREIRCSADVR